VTKGATSQFREVPRSELDALCLWPVLFDALIAEDDHALVFRKTVTRDDPGVAGQRATPLWPHHLPGDLIIALTGQAGVIAMRRKGVIDERWCGHGVRIRDARFPASVLIGETCYLRTEIGRIRRLRGSVHASFRFRMWKHGPDGKEIEVYRSEQEAMFFPGS
jgi:hypothetical protein